MHRSEAPVPETPGKPGPTRKLNPAWPRPTPSSDPEHPEKQRQNGPGSGLTTPSGPAPKWPGRPEVAGPGVSGGVARGRKIPQKIMSLVGPVLPKKHFPALKTRFLPWKPALLRHRTLSSRVPKPGFPFISLYVLFLKIHHISYNIRELGNMPNHLTAPASASFFSFL